MSTEAEDHDGPDDNLQPDPLLKSGAFIDLEANNGYSESETRSYPTTSSREAPVEPLRTIRPSTPVHYSNAASPEPHGEPSPQVDQRGGSGPSSDPSLSEVLDWLPPGWRVHSRVRASGASAGAKDKYYHHLESGRRFRSKKEVISFLGTGQETGQKKKRPSSSAGDSPAENGSQSKKSKKSATRVTAAVKKFNFDDVPAKVKWELTDIYEGSWRPSLGGGERVPEMTRQQWADTFTHLTMLNGGKPT
ncbi:Methyl-CpG-binding domain protein 5 [Dionaea muscipula]